eukprot:CAMPEP_0119101884 /NCGR_PEP_ID=MMETSP1180-20130426/801_1 /TAXON_ID=3052 ORGANISM="Chlamydomonas cf sp, Strain CCMP681" /NCGR_SAMPLE_ID=MMETSP1180 /ASSEMBLY_ACC=CAM_ASM_000741 /LENGTH=187 /DNA_ID=CAMNT_0007086065 /DNA_START=512 /DNA_END=1075 /DNA_ORIENTATION=+
MNFKADVVESLLQKQKSLNPGYQILVAEDVSAWHDSINELSQSPQQGQYGGTAVQYVDLSDMSLDMAARSPNVVGVLDVGMMDASESWRSLPHSTQAYAYISSMAVSETVRRQGVAHALMHAAEAVVIADGWMQPHIALDVYQDNEAAVALYLRCGFKIVAQDPQWKQWLGSRVRLCMAKDYFRQPA